MGDFWRIPRVVGLWYLSFSSCFGLRLLFGRLLSGTWGLDGKLLVQILVVSSLQSAALTLLAQQRRLSHITETPCTLGRFLLVWLMLIIPWLIGSGITLLIFRELDLHFVNYSTFIMLPVGQAGIVYWVIRPTAKTGWGRVFVALRQPLVMFLLLVNGVLLGYPQDLLENLAPLDGRLSMATIVQAGLAGLLLVVVAERYLPQTVPRIWFHLLTGLLFGLAVDPSLGWLERASDWLYPVPAFALGAWVWAVSLGVLTRVCTLLGTQYPVVTPWLSAAGLCLFLFAHLYALTLYHVFLPSASVHLLYAGLLGSIALLLMGLVAVVSLSRQDPDGDPWT